MELRTGSWCRDFDGVCNGSTADLFAALVAPYVHDDYFSEDGDSARAAREAAEALKILRPDKSEYFDASRLQFASASAGADLALVFDTTGSMWDEIDEAQAQATALAEAWLEFFPTGRVALVEYRDHGDAFVSRVDLELTNNVGDFQAAVNALVADGGGDTPEAVNSGVMTALNDLEWQDGATKTAVVIADAPGKDPEPITGYTRADVSQRALEIDPVAVYAVNVDGLQAVTDYFLPIAEATAGEVFILESGQSLADALFDVLEVVHLSPVETLNGPYFAETGTPIRFRADGSFDPDADLVTYEWDLDGDGTVDQTTSASQVDHTYPGDYVGLAAVRVVSSDGGTALATAQVTVDDVGLADLQPVTPQSADAAVTGSGQATVTWTPAPDDRADAYWIFLDDGTPLVWSSAEDPNSVDISGLDLSEPVVFHVAAVNRFGNSDDVATPSVGGGPGWSSTLRVNDDTGTTDQIQPVIAMGSDGTAHAVWRDSRGGNSDIYYARRDPATGAWSANERVSDVTTGDQFEPSIAVDGTGNVYVIWTDARVSDDRNIFFSKRAASTGTWSASVRVNDDPANKKPEQRMPAIAVSSSGAAVAVWRDLRSNKEHIYGARLAAGGSTWSASAQVTSVSSGKRLPDVVIGPDGTAHAVWLQPATGDADIWYASLASGSSTWSANSEISDDPGTAYQSEPEIGVDGAGNLLALWQDWRADPFQLRARARPSGGSWAPSVVVAADGANSPSLWVRSDGDAYAVWYADGFDVWAAGFDGSAGTWATPEQVNDASSSDPASSPAVAFDGSRVVVIWQNGTNIGGDYDYNIFERSKAAP